MLKLNGILTFQEHIYQVLAAFMEQKLLRFSCINKVRVVYTVLKLSARSKRGTVTRIKLAKNAQWT